MGVEAAIAALAAPGDVRTWSLIVTVFGDLARAPGAGIPGPVLSALTGRIGIRPEAMRVALHRLRKDAWIAARRAGRVSHYRLTGRGRDETARASGRIYAAAPPAPGRWRVLVAGPGDPAARLVLDGALVARGAVGLAPGAWLAPAGGAVPEGLFALDGAAPVLPDWLRASLMPEALAEGYARFAAALAAADAALPEAPPAALDRAALRVLVVHGWRRLVLRHPDLPDAFFPDDWAGPAARARVQALLARLGTPTLAEIAAELAEA